MPTSLPFIRSKSLEKLSKVLFSTLIRLKVVIGLINRGSKSTVFLVLQVLGSEINRPVLKIIWFRFNHTYINYVTINNPFGDNMLLPVALATGYVK